VKDATDIPRALEALHLRLILAGHSRHKLSRSGAFLARSLADMQLCVPSQPIYLKGHLSGGVVQNKEYLLRPGLETFDTRLYIPDLTDQEREQLAQYLAQAEAHLKPDMDATRAAYRTERATEIAQVSGVSHEAALAVIDSAVDTQMLFSDFVLHVGREQITVGQVLADPAKWHGKACRDPLDPFGGSKSAAKIYTQQPMPVVNSFLHGGAKYQMLMMPSVAAMPLVTTQQHAEVTDGDILAQMAEDGEEDAVINDVRKVLVTLVGAKTLTVEKTLRELKDRYGFGLGSLRTELAQMIRIKTAASPNADVGHDLAKMVLQRRVTNRLRYTPIATDGSIWLPPVAMRFLIR